MKSESASKQQPVSGRPWPELLAESNEALRLTRDHEAILQARIEAMAQYHFQILEISYDRGQSTSINPLGEAHPTLEAARADLESFLWHDAFQQTGDRPNDTWLCDIGIMLTADDNDLPIYGDMDGQCEWRIIKVRIPKSPAEPPMDECQLCHKTHGSDDECAPTDNTLFLSEVEG